MDAILGVTTTTARARRGKQRAALEVAPSTLVIAYHMLKRGTQYIDLEFDYFDKRNSQQLQRVLTEGVSLAVSIESP